jgi:hypothetical protein
MSTLGPNFIARPTPTNAQRQAAFAAWFNALLQSNPDMLRVANPGATIAAPLTFAQIQTFLAPAATPVVAAFSTYAALVSQIGTANPSATVLQNELSGAIVWTRDTPGVYVGTLAGAFVSTSTVFIVGSVPTPGQMVSLAWVDEDSFQLKSSALNSGTGAFDLADDLLIRCPVQILVYP